MYASTVPAPPQTLPLIGILRQLAAVVASLSAEQYTASPPAFAPSSIGAHVRHCLDHVAALLAAAGTGLLDYDLRARGTVVERDAAAALAAIDGMVVRLERLPAECLSQPILVRTILSAGQPPADLASSLERELAYVVSHTTHHNAIMGFLVRAVGGETPQHFGYAASTLAWLAGSAEARCAR